MGVMESLLLEEFDVGLPVEEKFHVWLAARPLGSDMGSGTQAEPYNCGLRSGPVFTGVTISHSGTTATATIPNHPYKVGDMVEIAGADYPDGYYYNGGFVVRSTTEDAFTYEMPAAPSADASGSITCTIDPYLFDYWMGKMLPYMTLHLLPGLFLTRGFVGGNPNRWTIRPGQKIIGSGVGLTTVKIVGAYSRTQGTLAFGSYAFLPPYDVDLPTFSASDFTVDCNLSGQPQQPGYQWPPVCCAAIGASGKQTRLTRIRAINFGSLAAHPSTHVECFVLGLAGGDPRFPEAVNCVVEDCILEQPCADQTWETTCVNCGRGPSPVDQVADFHRACVVRNCFFDLTYPNGSTCLPVAIQSIEKYLPGNDADRRYKVTTKTPHGKNIGGTVAIGNVYVGGFANNIFNNLFHLEGSPSTYTISDTEFWITLPGPNPGTPDASGAFIRHTFQAMSIDAGTTAVAEGNRIFNCLTGGPYHDSYASKDLLARNNFYSNVLAGPGQNMSSIPNGGTVPQALSLLHYDAVNALATATVASGVKHGATVGDAMLIAGASPAAYNGYWEVVAVTSNSFSFKPTSAPGADSSTGTFSRIFTVRRVVLERNIIELCVGVVGYGLPSAIVFYGQPIPQPIYREIIVRGNLIHHVNLSSQPNSVYPSFALDAASVGTGIVEHNIIGLDQTLPIVIRLSGQVEFFNNRTPSGKLVQAYDLFANKTFEQVENQVEAGLLSAILHRRKNL